jgi:hypothetical protein
MPYPFASSLGGFMSFKGEFMTITGGFMSVKGGFMTITGGFMSVKGGFKIVKREFMTAKGGFMTITGGFMCVKGGFKIVKFEFMTIKGGFVTVKETPVVGSAEHVIVNIIAPTFYLRFGLSHTWTGRRRADVYEHTQKAPINKYDVRYVQLHYLTIFTRSFINHLLRF